MGFSIHLKKKKVIVHSSSQNPRSRDRDAYDDWWRWSFLNGSALVCNKKIEIKKLSRPTFFPIFAPPWDDILTEINFCPSVGHFVLTEIMMKWRVHVGHWIHGNWMTKLYLALASLSLVLSDGCRRQSTLYRHVIMTYNYELTGLRTTVL